MKFEDFLIEEMPFERSNSRSSNSSSDEPLATQHAPWLVATGPGDPAYISPTSFSTNKQLDLGQQNHFFPSWSMNGIALTNAFSSRPNAAPTKHVEPSPSHALPDLSHHHRSASTDSFSYDSSSSFCSPPSPKSGYYSTNEIDRDFQNLSTSIYSGVKPHLALNGNAAVDPLTIIDGSSLLTASVGFTSNSSAIISGPLPGLYVNKTAFDTESEKETPAHKGIPTLRRKGRRSRTFIEDPDTDYTEDESEGPAKKMASRPNPHPAGSYKHGRIENERKRRGAQGEAIRELEQELGAASANKTKAQVLQQGVDRLRLTKREISLLKHQLNSITVERDHWKRLYEEYVGLRTPAIPVDLSGVTLPPMPNPHHRKSSWLER